MHLYTVPTHTILMQPSIWSIDHRKHMAFAACAGSSPLLWLCYSFHRRAKANKSKLPKKNACVCVRLCVARWIKLPGRRRECSAGWLHIAQRLYLAVCAYVMITDRKGCTHGTFSDARKFSGCCCMLLPSPCWWCRWELKFVDREREKKNKTNIRHRFLFAIMGK